MAKRCLRPATTPLRNTSQAESCARGRRRADPPRAPSRRSSPPRARPKARYPPARTPRKKKFLPDRFGARTATAPYARNDAGHDKAKRLGRRLLRPHARRLPRLTGGHNIARRLRCANGRTCIRASERRHDDIGPSAVGRNVNPLRRLSRNRHVGIERHAPARKQPRRHSLDGLGFETASPAQRAHVSTAHTPRTSVAVVMTGMAPAARATVCASSFAPPKCPDKGGTAKRPASSIATTAESLAFEATCGAIARTAMPAAPTNRSASDASHASAVHARRSAFPSPNPRETETSQPGSPSPVCAQSESAVRCAPPTHIPSQ